MAWATNNIVSNPSSGDIIADTGAIALGGLIQTTVLVWSTITCNVEIVQRNALNTADVNKQRLYALNSETGILPIQQVPVLLAVNERLLVRMVDSISGDIQASILT